jgi:translation initiation factor 4A
MAYFDNNNNKSNYFKDDNKNFRNKKYRDFDGKSRDFERRSNSREFEGRSRDNENGEKNRNPFQSVKNIKDNDFSEKLPNEEVVLEDYDENESITNWDELNISPDLLRGIYSYGFEKPSPIQQKACIPLIKGRDTIAQAQSGTGKTATFTIGGLSKVDTSLNTTQLLILNPTRELALQTANVVSSIGSMLKNLKVQLLVGGNSIDEDVYKLRNETPHVIVGCPGRIYDMMRRNFIVSKTIKLIVLDEADEMLSYGFKEQIYNIFINCDSRIQVALFSATLPEYIHEITEKFMRNPIKIIVKAESLTLEGISQFYVAIEDDKQKYETLKDIFTMISVSQCIIYCNSVNRVIDLYEAMKDDEFPVCCIHSNMTKDERTNAFVEFKSGKYRVLISSNVTARGIDIQQVSVVINFDLPKDIHTYLHRIGRSGRWGRKGLGINFITRRDIYKMKEIEQYYHSQINELPANFDTLLK